MWSSRCADNLSMDNLKISTFANSGIKTVYIHIGLPKTATSSIQATIHHNHPLLVSKGFHGFINGIQLFSMFSDDPTRFRGNIVNSRDERDIERYNRENKLDFLNTIKGITCEKVVISGEDLSNLKLEGVAEFNNFLIRLMPDAKFEIVCFVREKVSLVTSFVQQWIKVQDNFFADDVNQFDNFYQDRIAGFAGIYGLENMKVYPFENALKHPQGPVAFFLEAIGIDTDGLTDFDILNSNKSISDKACEVINYINDLMPTTLNKKLSVLRTDQDAQPLFLVRGAKYRLTKHQVDTILKGGEKDLAWLQDTFGIEYPSTLTDIRLPGKIRYDDDFCEDVISFYPRLTIFLKYAVYKFLCEKRFIVTDDQSQLNLKKLVAYVKQEHPYILNYCMDDAIIAAERSRDLCETSKRSLLDKFKTNSFVHNTHFYRDMALFLEQHNQVESAFHMMGIARDFSPNDPFVDDKCNLYRDAIIPETTKPGEPRFKFRHLVQKIIDLSSKKGFGKKGFTNFFKKKSKESKIKYLHVCLPLGFTHKYANEIKSNFNSQEHLFLFIGEADHHPLGNSVKLLDKNNTVTMLESENARIMDFLMKYSQECEKIFLHSLIRYEVVDFYHQNNQFLKKCYWLVWGFGLYYDINRVKFGPDFDTDAHLLKLKLIIHKMGNIITHLSEDYRLAKKKFGFHGNFIWALMYNMFDAQEELIFSPKLFNETINIVVGHAADENCNQIRTFEMISSLKTKNIRVFCPLSYGPRDLAEKIIKAGQTIFGEKFEPITEIMSLAEYDDFLSKMDIGIYDQKRQKGGKNITTMLSKGKKVYLSDDVTTYGSLTDYGLKIYAINEPNFENILEPITWEEALKNHEICNAYFSKQVYIRQWKEIFSI